MSVLRAAAVLLCCLTLQAALGRLVPAAHVWVDLMLVPVVWYAISRSQRAGMLMGCAAGLLEDAWFGLGAFGLGGFRKTLLGWVLGGIAGRVDLNHGPGRFLAGVLCTLADGLLERGFLVVLPLRATAEPLWVLAVRSLLTALVITMAFGVTDRIGGRASRERWR